MTIPTKIFLFFPFFSLHPNSLSYNFTKKNIAYLILTINKLKNKTKQKTKNKTKQKQKQKQKTKKKNPENENNLNDLSKVSYLHQYIFLLLSIIFWKNVASILHYYESTHVSSPIKCVSNTVKSWKHLYKCVNKLTEIYLGCQTIYHQNSSFVRSI